MATLTAGCAAPEPKSPAASDDADVWFMQHLAGHLLQMTAILDLSYDRISHPTLASSLAPCAGSR